MVDADPKIKLPHLSVMPSVEHHLMDIQSEAVVELIRGAVRTEDSNTIETKLLIAGIHLCGDLSRRAVDLFLRTEKATALVLSPCCLPRRRRHDVFGFHVVDQARSMKRDPHGMWCMALLGLLYAEIGTERNSYSVDMRRDDDVEGPFKTFLVARRKKDEGPFPDGSHTVCPRVEDIDLGSWGSGIGDGSRETGGGGEKRGVVAGRGASGWRVVGPKPVSREKT
jgi:hypothetical protein